MAKNVASLMALGAFAMQELDESLMRTMRMMSAERDGDVHKMGKPDKKSKAKKKARKLKKKSGKKS